MTRGCAILLAVASTCPSPDLASGFMTAPPMQSPAAPFRTSTRRSHSCCPRCTSWPPAAAASTSAATAVHRRRQHTAWALTAHSSDSPRGRFSAAGSIQGASRGARFALGGAAREGGQRNNMVGGGGNGGGGGGGGAGGLGLDVDEESLALARDAAKKEDYEWFMEFIGAGEDEGGGSGDGAPAPSSSSSSSSKNNNGGNRYGSDKRQTSSSQSYYDNDNSSGGSSGSNSRRQPYRNNGRDTGRDNARPQNNNVYDDDDDYYSSSPYYSNNNYDDVDTGSGRPRGKAASPRPRPGNPAPRSREFQSSTRGVNEMRGERSNAPPLAAADTAYDYDLDDEFDGEPGRGGWEYDPGLASGVGARRRDVDVGKLRAQTRAAAMRVPLEEEAEGAEEVVTAAGASGVEFEPVRGDKVVVLTGELGYTEQEVACIDPDMADLAIERGIRRPASGMPDDWVGVGAALAPPPTSSPSSSSSSPTLEGEGGGELGEAQAPALPGALDLDEILNYDTAEIDDDIDDGSEFGYEGRRGRGGGGTRRAPPPPPPSSLRSDKGGVGRDEDGRGAVGRRYEYGDVGENGYSNGSEDYGYDEGDGFSSPRRRQQQQGQQQQRRRQQPRRPDSPYYEDDDRSYYDRRGGGGGGNGDDREATTAREDPRYYYQDDDGRDDNPDRRQQQQQQQQPRRRGEQEAGRGRRGKRARPTRELDPAEKYERSLWGSDDDEDEEGKIWTGVGPDGPWPTLEEFTKLLREETDVRLSIVGPWAAEVVAVENKFRLQAYKRWLEVLDKGIGESLEEAGVFDAAFPQEREAESDKNLYDNYTNYDYPGGEEKSGGGRRRSGGGGGGVFDPRGGGDERGFDYDEGRRDFDSGRRRAGERGGGGRFSDDERRGGEGRKGKFDVGSFLRSVPESFMKPAAGMEEAAARFESKYPGRKPPAQVETPAGSDRDENDYFPGDRRGSRDGRGGGGGDEEEEEEGRRRQQQRRRTRGGGGGDEYRRSDGSLEGGEDSYEY